MKSVTNLEEVNAPIKTNIGGDLINLGVGEMIELRDDYAEQLKVRYPWLVLEDIEVKSKSQKRKKK